MSAETGFCHVTLCGRLVEKPIIADPPLRAIVRCPDGSYEVLARGLEAKALVRAGTSALLLIRGRGQVHQWKTHDSQQPRSRMVIDCQSVRILDGKADSWAE